MHNTEPSGAETLEANLPATRHVFAIAPSRADAHLRGGCIGGAASRDAEARGYRRL
ncbi:hypothetical protein L226DRAFT_531686 [Lentinus tigrinus ALCF2SS1-7]|uniref:uncharacterized protein n=1 Tax=Lentinus tigrinus ALCF2SS1-7 TaxID=1328758 RepID=UPI0011660794|nr:hypothetical protein L226DRAFT_531686 [Lentinus tigrinus ALCF2SS1-7]